MPESIQNVSKETQEFAANYARTPVEIPSLGIELETAFVGPSGLGAELNDRPPVCLLHGFDGSSLDYRRLKPALSEKLPTWAVDLVINQNTFSET